MTKPAVAKHSDITNHGVLFDKTRMQATTPSYYPRMIRETIEKLKKNFNINNVQLARIWHPVIDKLNIVLDN